MAAMGNCVPPLPGCGKAAARTSTAAAFGAFLRFSLKAFCTERTTRSTPALLQPAHGARPVPGAHRPL